MLSLIIPVYRNEGSLPALVDVLAQLFHKLEGRLEVVFVIDASPDNSAAWLHDRLRTCIFPSKLIELARNFGSFAAIREGLTKGSGPYFAVMAADLQEPPSLIEEFYSALHRDECDVAIGTRHERNDPFLSRLNSQLFWGLYRRLVQRSMPSGGVDIFACNQKVKDQLVALRESNSSLVGLVFWVGFRRKYISYARLPREHGKSAWTMKKKIKYLSDSVFSFSDLPIQLLLLIGMFGILISLVLSTLVMAAKITGYIPIPGYAATVLVILFFAGLNSLGLGLIGSYVWRAFENTKQRPLSIVMNQTNFSGARSFHE
jgi:glycosyltransferase involved in cell wall biosynthesis